MVKSRVGMTWQHAAAAAVTFADLVVGRAHSTASSTTTHDGG
jgi:hypothetical protein